MKIENIHVDGFGVWNDKTWGPLDPGLNVFHGPNETGKSTLMGFIRAMLFGFAVSGTEEPLLIAEQLTFSRALLLMVLSLLQVHAIVYAVDFKVPSKGAGSRTHKLAVLREGVSTYALSLLVGTFLLWTFRTLDAGTGIVAAVYAILAIGFVTSLGAAAAELLI